MQLTALQVSVLLLADPAGGNEQTTRPGTIESLAAAFVETELAPGIAIGVLDESGRSRIACAGTLAASCVSKLNSKAFFWIFHVFLATLLLREHRWDIGFYESKRVFGKFNADCFDECSSRNPS